MFHVGGLGIYARAYLSGAEVISMAWDPATFAEQPMTLSALVPAQVRDLVKAGLTPPKSLRAIVIGGGATSEELYRDAIAAGWPVLPSYGMTECCSQIATARPGSPDLIVLDHIEVEATEESFLAFRGDSLLTGYITEDGFHDPKVDGWLITEDRGSLEGNLLRIRGRSGDFIKIGGESVDLARLDQILMSIAGLDAAIVAVPDARLGHVIHLAAASENGARIAAEYDARVLPFERARAVHRVAVIPRTPLGKLMRKTLLEELPKVVE
jgi:O-succinylbenzoic acid--CoA ligase